MSAVPIGYANPRQPNFDPFGTPQGPIGPTGPAGSPGEAGLAGTPGATGPAGPTGPSAGGGQIIQTGVIEFNQAVVQPVFYPVPFNTEPKVFITPTGNGAGVNGFMYPGTYGQLDQFLCLYSATHDPQFGPIICFYVAIGT